MTHPKLIDTTYAFETPEGVALELNVAGVVPRALAWGVDLLIQVVIYIVLAIALLGFGEFGQGIFSIAVFLVWWFYPVYFELRTGSTPGKKMYDLTVVHDNGTPITWQASVTRNLLRSADFFPFMFGFGIVSLLATKNFKRLGDIAAGTLVVYRQKIDPDAELPSAAPVALPETIDMSAQRAILSFAERGTHFSDERKQELAGYLLPFIQLDRRHDAALKRSGLQNAFANHTPAHPPDLQLEQNHAANYLSANGAKQNPVQTVLGYASWILSGGRSETSTPRLSDKQAAQNSMSDTSSRYTPDDDLAQFGIHPNNTRHANTTKTDVSP